MVRMTLAKAGWRVTSLDLLAVQPDLAAIAQTFDATGRRSSHPARSLRIAFLSQQGHEAACAKSPPVTFIRAGMKLLLRSIAIASKLYYNYTRVKSQRPRFKKPARLHGRKRDEDFGRQG